MPPGFKIAEPSELRLHETRGVEAKEVEWKAQPFLQPLKPVGSLSIGAVAHAPALKSFIDLGERPRGTDPQFSEPKIRYDRLVVDFSETRFTLMEANASRVEERNIPPLLLATAVGLTAFFGFIGEALGGPATELILQGKKSPIKMQEGVPEPGNPNDLPHGRDFMGGAEAKMIGVLVFIMALPFIYGKAKRSYRAWKSEKQAKLEAEEATKVPQEAKAPAVATHTESTITLPENPAK